MPLRVGGGGGRLVRACAERDGARAAGLARKYAGPLAGLLPLLLSPAFAAALPRFWANASDLQVRAGPAAEWLWSKMAGW